MVNAVDGSAYFLALWIWQINKQTKILTKELMITTLNT